MTRFISLQPTGRAALRGGVKRKAQGLLGPRPFRPAAPDPDVSISVNGKTLNRWEAKVWFALQRRGEDWQPQVRIGNELGVGVCDFLSWSRRQVIEVDGPFHDTQGGQAKDFHRVLVRQAEGLQTIRVKETDLTHIDEVLSQKLFGVG